MTGFVQQLGEVFSVLKSCNKPIPLPWYTTELSDFRTGILINSNAVATIKFRMDVIHNYLNGYTGAIGISSHLLMRSGKTWEETQSAKFQYVDNAVCGSNIASLTAHYGKLDFITKVPLEANTYYEFSVTGSAHSSASSSNGLASSLVENGIGFNCLIIEVDTNEVLIS